MFWNKIRRKEVRAFKQVLWDQISAISTIRSANSPPPPNADAHIDFLEDVLVRYERLLETEDGRKLDLKAGMKEDLPCLRFALDQLRRYNQASGVEEVGNENARIYIFFIQSRLMHLADAADDRLQASA